MNFLGSVSSSASTPASNGSSLNGLSDVVSSGAVSSGAVSSGAVSSPKSNDSPLSWFDGSETGIAGLGPAIFNLYLVSKILLFRLFFLTLL
jgi:hypothetical protein